MNSGGGEQASKTNTICRPAKPEDVPYIDSLRKKEGAALGFIPIGAYQSVTTKMPVDGRRRWEYSKLIVTEDNGDLTGFCYATFWDDNAHIFQIVVQEDARRWQRAMLMIDVVESHARHLQKSSISCRVAFDLESNFFWRAIGYEAVRQVMSTWLNQKESASKRPLWHYNKKLELGLFPDL